MSRILRLMVVAVGVGAGSAAGGTAAAGGIWFGNDGQPSSYSPLRFWAPQLGRLNDHVHGPNLNMCAPDRHPENPPTVITLKYPCRTALPAETLIPRPTPPATSPAR